MLLLFILQQLVHCSELHSVVKARVYTDKENPAHKLSRPRLSYSFKFFFISFAARNMKKYLTESHGEEQDFSEQQALCC